MLNKIKGLNASLPEKFSKQNSPQSRELTGKSAEKAAEIYLKSQGLTPVTQNFRCRQGEVDLIMEHSGTIVFVEVKYRKHAGFGSPLETVTAAKQKKVRIAAQHYLAEKKLTDVIPVRFDVLGICGDDYQWIQSAF